MGAGAVENGEQREQIEREASDLESARAKLTEEQRISLDGICDTRLREHGIYAPKHEIAIAKILGDGRNSVRQSTDITDVIRYADREDTQRKLKDAHDTPNRVEPKSQEPEQAYQAASQTTLNQSQGHENPTQPVPDLMEAWRAQAIQDRHQVRVGRYGILDGQSPGAMPSGDGPYEVAGREHPNATQQSAGDKSLSAGAFAAAIAETSRAVGRDDSQTPETRQTDLEPKSVERESLYAMRTEQAATEADPRPGADGQEKRDGLMSVFVTADTEAKAEEAQSQAQHQQIFQSTGRDR